MARDQTNFLLRTQKGTQQFLVSGMQALTWVLLNIQHMYYIWKTQNIQQIQPEVTQSIGTFKR